MRRWEIRAGDFSSAIIDVCFRPEANICVNKLLFMACSHFAGILMPEEPRAKCQIWLCDKSYFVTPAAQNAVWKISTSVWFFTLISISEQLVAKWRWEIRIGDFLSVIIDVCFRSEANICAKKREVHFSWLHAYLFCMLSLRVYAFLNSSIFWYQCQKLLFQLKLL